MVNRFLLILSVLSLYDVSAQSTQDTELSKIDSYIRGIRTKLHAFEEANEANEGVHQALQKALVSKIAEREQYLGSTEDQDEWLDEEDVDSMRQAAKRGEPWVRSTHSHDASSKSSLMTVGTAEISSSVVQQLDNNNLDSFPTAALSAATREADLDRIWHELLAIKTMQAELREALLKEPASSKKTLKDHELGALGGEETETLENNDIVIVDGQAKVESASMILDEDQLFASDASRPIHDVEAAKSSLRKEPKREAVKKAKSIWLKEYEALRSKMDD